MVRREVRFKARRGDDGMFYLDTWVIEAVADGFPTKSLDKTEGPFRSEAEARSFAKANHGATPGELL